MILEMREKNTCCVIAVILLLLGMCLDTTGADSSFLYEKAAHTTSTIGSVSYITSDVESCTTDMLGKSNSISIRNDAGRNIVKVQYRIILLSVIVGAILQYLLYFHSTVCGEYYRIIQSSTVAVKYIHCKDGEK